MRLAQFLEEKDGRLSSRRLVGLMCAVALVLALVRNPTHESLIWAVNLLAATGLGLTTWETVAKGKQDAQARASGAHRAVEG
jgi:Flp pilus assembly protein TadB